MKDKLIEVFIAWAEEELNRKDLTYIQKRNIIIETDKYIFEVLDHLKNKN